ncbi:hypothetical protein PSENEW3_00001017 [Picochlorum sp. SENEW3]|nr:hypothetical protein PSENEW3_00001017 [Picochlorum sp. SENEW3]
MTSFTQAIMAASARAAEEEEGFDFHDANDPLGSPRTPRGLWRLAVKAALASREPPNSIVWGGFPFDLQEVKMKRLQALEESNSEVHIGAPGGFSPWSDIVHLIQMLGSSKLNILLLAVPVGIAGGILKWSPSIVFAANFLALLPLALILGELTEDLILRFGETIGGLLNATFGNVVEMILGLAALSHGLMDVVAASLIGSILSNLLLVLGCCFFFGGSRFKTQQFNSAGNKAATSLLFLACISVITPTMASVLYGPDVMAPETLQLLSHCIAVLLVGMYICYLFFQLKTHSESFSTNDLREDHVNSLGRHFSDAEDPTLSASLLDSYEIGPVLSVSGAITGLTLVTITVALCSEYLTGAIEAVSEKTHINKSFLGLILLPIAGNAAEHFTAVFLALKNKMDAAISIAVGSSIQIAVFVLPVTVLVGWVIGRPFTLNFDPFAVTILTLSVVLAYFVTSDGKSNWLLGLQLILTYTLISFVYLLKHDIP